VRRGPKEVPIARDKPPCNAMSQSLSWTRSGKQRWKIAMADQPLKEQGLVSVKELWVNTYPRLGNPLLSPEGGIGSVNRPVRTRMQGEDPTLADVARQMRGNVGRGSLKLPFTRFD
jgi:hypothetical protein